MTNFDKYYFQTFKPLEAKIKAESKKLFELYKTILSSTNKTNVYWKRIEIEMAKHYKLMDVYYAEWNKINIPKVYKKEMYKMSKKIKSTKRITKIAKIPTTTLIKSNTSLQLLTTIVNDSLSSMSSSIFSGQKMFRRFARMTQQTLINEVIFEQSIIREFAKGDVRGAVKQQYAILKQQMGNEQFIQAGSRMYKPHYYAEMVTRTKFHETQSYGALMTAVNYDTDLVKVSSHNTTTVICQEYEGKIYSISGKSKLFPVLTEMPPYHPNCLHLLYPEFIEAYDKKTVNELSEFANGKIDKPPFPAGFVPISERVA